MSDEREGNVKRDGTMRRPPPHDGSPSSTSSPSLSGSPNSRGEGSSCNTSSSSPQSGFPASKLPVEDYENLFIEFEDPELQFSWDDDASMKSQIVSEITITFKDTDVKNEGTFSMKISAWLQKHRKMKLITSTKKRKAADDDKQGKPGDDDPNGCF